MRVLASHASGLTQLRSCVRGQTLSTGRRRDLMRGLRRERFRHLKMSSARSARRHVERKCAHEPPFRRRAECRRCMLTRCWSLRLRCLVPRCRAKNAHFGVEGEILQVASTEMHGRRRNTSRRGLGHCLSTRKFRCSLRRDVVVHRPYRGLGAVWNHHSKSAIIDPTDLLRCNPCVRSERTQWVRSPEGDMLRNRLLRRFSCAGSAL